MPRLDVNTINEVNKLIDLEIVDILLHCLNKFYFPTTGNSKSYISNIKLRTELSFVSLHSLKYTDFYG
jgi:hypothetical protein